VRRAWSPLFPLLCLSLSLSLCRSLFRPVYSASNARCPSSPNPSLSVLVGFGGSLGRRLLDYPNSAIFGFHTPVKVLLIMLRLVRGLFSKCSSLSSCPAFSFTFVAPRYAYCYAYCFLSAAIELIAMHSFFAFLFIIIHVRDIKIYTFGTNIYSFKSFMFIKL